MMGKFATKNLESDPDATLTLRALHTYQDLIKQRNKSIEGLLLTKHINGKMWSEIHFRKDRLFNLPVKMAIESEIEKEVELINNKIWGKMPAAATNN